LVQLGAEFISGECGVKVIKIGQDLPNLLQQVYCHFWWTTVYIELLWILCML